MNLVRSLGLGFQAILSATAWEINVLTPDALLDGWLGAC